MTVLKVTTVVSAAGRGRDNSLKKKTNEQKPSMKKHSLQFKRSFIFVS